MTNLPSRLRRHLSYANVMATIAVFLAFGGVGYAATTINGNKIVKQTIGAGKLKKGTLTSAQVKANALTGSVIDESTLSVPTAQSAASATTAGSANTASSANTANSANTAKSATSADTAGSANTAKNAETADHALSADTATTATTATSAGTATTAGDADTLGGFTAQQLQIACQAGTKPFGGMCWEDDPRPIAGWIAASITCGNAGGRLPSLSELIAYIAQPGTQVSSENWSGDASDFDAIGNEEIALTRDESGTASKRAPANLGYRCLFYRTN